jgi:hypothetical protein
MKSTSIPGSHPDQGRSFREAGHRQGHVGDKGVIAAPVPEREQSLKDRESRTRDEDPERGEQRPEVPLLAVAERMPGVGRAFAPAQGGQQECLIERVRG